MRSIKWNPLNIKKLKELYNKGLTDFEIAKELGGTVYSIGKKRSNLGLVKSKRKTHKRKPKIIVLKKECNNFIGHYIENDVDHFINLGCDEINSEKIATQILENKLLKSITILKPYTRIIPKGITKVKL